MMTIQPVFGARIPVKQIELPEGGRTAFKPIDPEAALATIKEEYPHLAPDLDFPADELEVNAIGSLQRFFTIPEPTDWSPERLTIGSSALDQFMVMDLVQARVAEAEKVDPVADEATDTADSKQYNVRMEYTPFMPVILEQEAPGKFVLLTGKALAQNAGNATPLEALRLFRTGVIKDNRSEEQKSQDPLAVVRWAKELSSFIQQIRFPDTAPRILVEIANRFDAYFLGDDPNHESQVKFAPITFPSIEKLVARPLMLDDPEIREIGVYASDCIPKPFPEDAKTGQNKG